MHSAASYLLVVLGAGSNASSSAKDIRKVPDSVGIEAEDRQLNKVSCELNSKNIRDVIAQGIGKLASVPAGGAVALSAARLPATRSAPAAADEKEKKEKSLVSADDVGFSLSD